MKNILLVIFIIAFLAENIFLVQMSTKDVMLKMQSIQYATLAGKTQALLVSKNGSKYYLTGEKTAQSTPSGAVRYFEISCEADSVYIREFNKKMDEMNK